MQQQWDRKIVLIYANWCACAIARSAKISTANPALFYNRRTFKSSITKVIARGTFSGSAASEVSILLFVESQVQIAVLIASKTSSWDRLLCVNRNTKVGVQLPGETAGVGSQQSPRRCNTLLHLKYRDGDWLNGFTRISMLHTVLLYTLIKCKH
jgi:hypothetical protein